MIKKRDAVHFGYKEHYLKGPAVIRVIFTWTKLFIILHMLFFARFMKAVNFVYRLYLVILIVAT